MQKISLKNNAYNRKYVKILQIIKNEDPKSYRDILLEFNYNKEEYTFNQIAGYIRRMKKLNYIKTEQTRLSGKFFDLKFIALVEITLF